MISTVKLKVWGESNLQRKGKSVRILKNHTKVWKVKHFVLVLCDLILLGDLFIYLVNLYSHPSHVCELKQHTKLKAKKTKKIKSIKMSVKKQYLQGSISLAVQLLCRLHPIENIRKSKYCKYVNTF